MATNIDREIYADLWDKTRDLFTVTDTKTNLTIYNFDNLSATDNFHDQLNLTALFDALGGAYTDGSNDLQDRANALQFQYGDFNGDGVAYDARLTIQGVSDFKIDFIDTAFAGPTGFDLGTGSGLRDDIALTNKAPAGISPDGTSVKAGDGTLYDSELNSFSITSDGHIKVNGVIDANTNGVTELVVFNGALYQSAPDPSDGGKSVAWWQYTEGSGYKNWTETSDPKGDTLTTSPTPTTTPIPTPVPSTPTPTPEPMPTTSTGKYLGEFPAHWARLSNGINVERSEFNKVSDADMKYLHDIGVQNFRVFLCPDEYLKFGQAMNPETNGQIQYLKSFMDRAIKAGIAVVVTPFSNEKAPAYMSNPNDTASINQYVSWMKEFAGWVNKHYDAQDVFIETRNEPVLNTAAADSQDNLSWWKIQEKFVAAVHEVAPNFTVEASANGWSSPTILPQMTPYADANVVYQFHYYNPMSFTSQGASWVPWAMQFSNEQWPGSSGVTLASVQNELAKIESWAQANDVFVHAGEFGVINNSRVPADDRAQWYTDLRTIFDKYGWGWDAWDYNKSFSITNTDSSGRETVQDAILKALDWGKYSTHDSPWDALQNGTGSTTTTGNTGGTSTPTTPTTTPSGTASFTGDASFVNAEKFTLTAADLTKTVTINNFDSVSGSPTGIKDQVNLDAIFDALGGKFTDGVNDLADRKAALHLVNVDLNGDGRSDMQVTIDGADSFHLNFVNSIDARVTSFEIGNGTDPYDNIVIA